MTAADNANEAGEVYDCIDSEETSVKIRPARSGHRRRRLLLSDHIVIGAQYV